MKKLPDHKENLTYNAPAEAFEMAKRLKRKMTKAEKILWHELRNRNLNGYKFRRQHPIAWYIADFYCHKEKLVIELDGEVHDTEEMKEHDEKRNRIMEEFDIKVLRFKNEEVFGNVDEVVKMIMKHLP
ncbi:MAG: endonuclease domain-containing protein [Bacteroidetes bacterium]|nr:endonuclease domain-containing protein [Bacteroidota bacterium]